MIYANHKEIEDWEDLLLGCLELGFRHLDPRGPYTPLTHTEHHQGLVNVVFKSQNSESIADLIRAWTTGNHLPKPAVEMLGVCTGHLISLHKLVPFSPRLWQLINRFVMSSNYKGFEGQGEDKTSEFLDHLYREVGS